MTPRIVCTLVALCAVLPAQTGGEQQPQRSTDSRPTTDSPFKPGDLIKEIFFNPPPKGPEEEFNPLPQRPTLPTMKLKGLLRLKGRDKQAALVEVGDVGTYAVREGERLAFTVNARMTMPRPQPAPGTPGAQPGATGAGVPTDRPTREDLQAEKRKEAQGQPTTGTGARATPNQGVVVNNQMSIVLRIVRVSSDGVFVEVGSPGELLIIR